MLKDKEKISGNTDGKLNAMDDVVFKAEKMFGKGSIMCLGEIDRHINIRVISTGSLGLDLALGTGGIPRGRVTEIFGPESSGKTTLAYHIVAESQKAGGIALYIDVEHALDPVYAEACGIRTDKLYLSQPNSGEEALQIAEMAVLRGAVDVVVIDSVAALAPKAELEGEMGEYHVGLQARLMSQALRKLCSVISNNRTAVIFINQLRARIGGLLYVNPEVTTGGRALKYYATIRIDLRARDGIGEGERKQRVGSLVTARVVKNKLAIPFRQAQFEILYGRGINHEGEVLDLGLEMAILDKSSRYYLWDKKMLGSGREAARAFLQEHSDVARQIERLIRTKSLPPVSETVRKSESDMYSGDEVRQYSEGS